MYVKNCNCPNGSYWKNHTRECYEEQIRELTEIANKNSVEHVAGPNFTDKVSLRCSHEVWTAFKAKDENGIEVVRIEFVDGSALEVRPASFNGTLLVKEIEA